MSTTPEDPIIAALSRWLAGHVDNERLRGAIESTDRRGLAPAQADALDELLAELERAGPTRGGELQVAVRETLEALALG